MSKILMFLVAFMATPWLAEAQKFEPVRLFVTTQEIRDGFADPDIKQRRDSVKDVRAALKHKNIKLLDADEASDVIIDVVSRRQVADGGSYSHFAPLFGSLIGFSAPTRKPTVYIAIRAGDYLAAIQGEGSNWRHAARVAGNQIRSWLQENYLRIMDRRRTTS